MAQMKQNAADVGGSTANHKQLQQEFEPPGAMPGEAQHGNQEYEIQEGINQDKPPTLVSADKNQKSRVGRGLKQDLPPEVLARLAEMGLSPDDVEIVQYPPGTDPDEALNDYYSRQVI
ncbi:hypothetical protein DUNSADRAFT_5865 [Dunaliella salina]|uniref:Uncharacterized protein n=1 Tax=Dunaliella salina TaxID=3046 RepID=A0ABQ7GPE2_DUNSA|nr:hypothetical protein DUNSADRAFT_5865 [Dunaliella salina]|eukprot:KAF5836479.1 hypothetical protein DUNSADRAFT_5865 [Dunaliella salina]